MSKGDQSRQPKPVPPCPDADNGRRTTFRLVTLGAILSHVVLFKVLSDVAQQRVGADVLFGPFRDWSEISFFLLSAILFVLLAWRTSAQMKVWKRIRADMRAHFSWPDGSSSTTKQPPDAWARVLRESAGVCRKTGRHHPFMAFKAAEPFAERIEELARLLAVQSDDSEITARTLERQVAGLPEAHPLRAIDQSITSALLFVGIIGTFFGLMSMLLSADMQNLITGAAGPDTGRISGVLSGLGTAFLSSLFAYIGYLFGRPLAELCDEDYEATTRSFTTWVQGRLAIDFPGRGSLGKVDLTTDAVKTLAANQSAINEATQAANALVREVQDAARQMIAATDVLKGAVAAVADATKTITDSAAAATTAWTKAADRWETTTNSFAATAGPLSDAFGAAAERMAGYEKKLGEYVEGMFESVLLATEQHGKVLTEHANTVSTRVNAAATRMTDRLDGLSEQLRAGTTDLLEIKKAHADLAEQTRAGGEQLFTAIDAVLKTSQGFQDRTIDLLQALKAADDERSEGVRRALEVMAARLEAQKTYFENIHRTITGESGPPDDLVTVLRELRNAMQPRATQNGVTRQ